MRAQTCPFQVDLQMLQIDGPFGPGQEGGTDWARDLRKKRSIIVEFDYGSREAKRYLEYPGVRAVRSIEYRVQQKTRPA